MSKRLTNYLVIIAAIIFISASITQTTVKVSAAEPVISAVTHAPNIVSQNTNVTVTVTFVDDTNVTEVKIQYCAIEPVFLCYAIKIDMTNVAENVWEGTFTVIEESGLIGYELYIYHTEGDFIAPNSSDYLGLDNIEEPYPDIFYFGIQLENNTATQTAPASAGWICVSLTFSGMLIIRTIIRKRKN
ncbi:MAG: hypothetical protein FK734_02220 [Asgard group archaeon]|nr:hypothetical protein [Asgard group archaeon]